MSEAPRTAHCLGVVELGPVGIQAAALAVGEPEAAEPMLVALQVADTAEAAELGAEVGRVDSETAEAELEGEPVVAARSELTAHLGQDTAHPVEVLVASAEVVRTAGAAAECTEAAAVACSQLEQLASRLAEPVASCASMVGPGWQYSTWQPLCYARIHRSRYPPQFLHGRGSHAFLQSLEGSSHLWPCIGWQGSASQSLPISGSAGSPGCRSPTACDLRTAGARALPSSQLPSGFLPCRWECHSL